MAGVIRFYTEANSHDEYCDQLIEKVSWFRELGWYYLVLSGQNFENAFDLLPNVEVLLCPDYMGPETENPNLFDTVSFKDPEKAMLYKMRWC